jgi:hypothetical protein
MGADCRRSIEGEGRKLEDRGRKSNKFHDEASYGLRYVKLST